MTKVGAIQAMLAPGFHNQPPVKLLATHERGKGVVFLALEQGWLELEGTRVERDYTVQRLTATLAHALEKGALDTAESISFNIGEMLAAADDATIATLEKLAVQLDNDYLAEALEEARD